jgi:hypothetical protein
MCLSSVSYAEIYTCAYVYVYICTHTHIRTHDINIDTILTFSVVINTFTYILHHAYMCIYIYIYTHTL